MKFTYFNNCSIHYGSGLKFCRQKLFACEANSMTEADNQFRREWCGLRPGGVGWIGCLVNYNDENELGIMPYSENPVRDIGFYT